MEENYFKIPYYIIKMNEHLEIKSRLQSFIDYAEFQISDEITKSDFHLKKKQDYQEFILPFLLKNLEKIFQKSEIKILDFWFQEYARYSFHPYHTHYCQWALVYYLNLPEGAGGTVFQEYRSAAEIKPKVQEGDIIIFPGWIKHKSPTNKGSNIKSIVAMNFEVKSQ
ncbi:MAG: hypothetical protein EBU90_09845 [Proteobacteria bacterium]|nr:hypothetical protein [Pseudomonadota bacterium]NBP14554.1 hypothetical protein [bacterium]